MTSSKGPNIIRLVIIAYACLIVFQLFRWQILNNEKFTALANDQRTVQRQIFTKRGTIYTQDGVVLSVDSASWDLVLSIVHDSDKDVFNKKRNEIIESLSSIVGVTEAEIEKKITDKTLAYTILFHNITKRQRDIIEDKSFPGIFTQESPRRLYPNGTLASQLIGYVGTDQFGNARGYYGLEGFFWGDIKGKQGLTQQENDLMGNAIISKEYQSVSFREGKNLVLTINSGIQKKVEKFLEEGVKELQGDSGTVIILTPNTGEIVTMANFPTYNPNSYWETKDLSTFKNKGVSDPYEYGSVHKPMTIAIAMESGKLKETDICTDAGSLKVLDRVIYNFNKAKYGQITPKDVLRFSDNVCSAQYGLLIGPTIMYDYLKKFGFGIPVGLGLQEEELSFLKEPGEWVDTDTATIAFGQTISATPLQLISALSALANDGERMQPYLVQKIYNNEEEINIKPKSNGQVISKDTARKVSAMMEYAIMSQRDMARFRGKYSIAGKTGTAQIPRKDGPGYYDDRTNVTFVGFSPSVNARVIMLVKIENPKNGSLANLTVLPLWSKIFDSIKDDLGVPRIN